MLKYKYILKTYGCKLSNSTRKLSWFEITKMLIAVKKNKLIVSSVIIFGISLLSFSSPATADAAAKQTAVLCCRLLNHREAWHSISARANSHKQYDIT